MQKNISEYIMKQIGFDFTRGRLDKSVHPFCGGSTNDVRITTRYNDENPFSSLDGVMPVSYTHLTLPTSDLV